MLSRLFIERVAAALRETKLEAIVVGNTASMLNGAPVTTQDVDLLVRDTPINRKKLRAFAQKIGGAGPHPITGLTTTERIFGAQHPVDILFDKMVASGSFASVRSRAHTEAIGSDVLTVASLADVIKSKKAANRPKDRDVMSTLEATLATRIKRGMP